MNCTNSKNSIKLRAHHLLCCRQFAGNGYDEKFINNMTEKLRLLKSGCPVHIASAPDDLCSSCPNLVSSGCRQVCSLDNNSVEQLDRRLIELLDLDTSKEYESVSLFSQIRENITEPVFMSVCGSCRWYKKGLCSYSAFRQNFTAVPSCSNT